MTTPKIPSNLQPGPSAAFDNRKAFNLQDAGAARTVPFDRPWEWLAAGWRDLWQVPSVSLAFGGMALALGIALGVVLLLAGLESLLPILAGGFLLVGPMLAIGLYEKSRALKANETPSIAGSALAVRRASVSGLGLLTAFLLIVYILWLRVAFLLLALFLGTHGLPPAREFMSTLLFTPQGLGLLVVGTAVGAVLASVVFTATAISIPMVMDQKVDALTAVARSFQAVAANIKPMALWAVLIAGFIAFGIATLGLGLLVTFPLVGHATWHAYCDIAQPQDN
ncbi:MAG: DUF2189 domain-containing protein [Hyphomicrobiaceae bacterium]